MDNITHEVRLESWKAIIEKCQARPTDQTAKQWMSENGISDGQYYYWQRKIRKQIYSEVNDPVPDSGSQIIPRASFVEIPAETVIEEDHTRPLPVLTIRTEKASIEITTAVPNDMIFEIIKAVRHAL